MPENAFASVQLRRAAVMLRALGQGALATQADGIAATVEAGLAAHAVINHPVAGRVWAFELVRGRAGRASCVAVCGCAVRVSGLMSASTPCHPRHHRLLQDGFGNALFMDDANIPSLLAMPYYGEWSDAGD